ncbi:hypothetical protein IFO70_11010 [Phormidium tenue FACHB-886]|nr:hypothetical protein [Phormidium tenue FACHB-886]
MKRVTLASLSALLLTVAITPVVRADVTAVTTPIRSTIATPSVTPFDLVSLAYQGFLHDEGIPRFATLSNDYTLGRVSAEDLVRGAIATNRLPASAIDDAGYVRAVDYQLQSLSRDSLSGR